jgi:hypothetical protein
MREPSLNTIKIELYGLLGLLSFLQFAGLVVIVKGLSLLLGLLEFKKAIMIMRVRRNYKAYSDNSELHLPDMRST